MSGRHTVRASVPEISLVTIPNVELLETGEDWATSTGVFTFTDEDLASAVAAQDDPAVRTPIIKLGHIDARFDGQPSFGRILNMHTVNNGQTLVGDLVGVPVWLASIMASAFPRRSIEGDYNYPTRTGNTWPFALTAVALLGAAYPAINTLEDLQMLWGSTAPTLYPVEELEPVLASTTETRLYAVKVADMPQWKELPMKVQAAVKAAVSVEDIRRSYYETLNGTQYWWWIREVRVDPSELIVDDDEGGLYRVPYTISGDTITFGDETQVKIEYVDVAASTGNPVAAAVSIPKLNDGQRVMASYNNPGEAKRPRRVAAEDGGTHTEPESGTVPSGDPAPNPEGTEITTVLSAEALAKLGLPPDASEDEINAAILASSGGGEGGADDGNGDSQPETQPTEPNGEPATGTPDAPDTPATPAETPATPSVPEGMVLVDGAQWAQVQKGLEEAGQLVAASRKKERDDLLTAAIQAGKFPKSRRGHYEALLSADPEGTKQLIASLAPGVVPTNQIGETGGGETVATDNQYPDTWKSSVAASTRGARASRVKVVSD